ncbi:MAG: RIP metalloprotease RseP [Gammaproteobacteria bacterium]
MTGFVGSLISFIVAISVLVAIHEFGHFWVARKLGVKVLRFSIGFGMPLYKKVFGKDQTEFTISAIPLGGYVKMLDEREAPVAEEDLSRTFNRQALWKRSAILFAGPAFNFLFAIFAYWVVFVLGVPGMKPVVGDIEPDSIAAQSGLQTGDELLMVADKAVQTWEMTSLVMLESVLDRRQIEIMVRDTAGQQKSVPMDFQAADDVLDKGGLLHNLGITPARPTVPAIIDKTVAGGAAESAGLQSGDEIMEANGEPISHWFEWVDVVRNHPQQTMTIRLKRADDILSLSITPDAVDEEEGAVGRIGAYVRPPTQDDNPYRVIVRYNPASAFSNALTKTWDMSVLTLQSLWGMLTGRASIENISGPISIAQYAGYSAQAGLSSFMKFLAIVSISLGVLNLLPVPILDGGHLLYNGIEWITGKPLSEAAQEQGFRIGILLLVMLMGIAFYNDLSRVLGSG